tara:strand:+ start:2191 stop:5433 length:3243 start_codon:yes stop_codon:yes gene_type:complete
MADFGWAYIGDGTAITGSGGGTAGGNNSLQFRTSDTAISGTNRLTWNDSTYVMAVTGNLEVSGTIVGNTLNVRNVNYVQSTIMSQTGSNQFGDTLDDDHSFTGSIQQTGSYGDQGKSYFLDNIGIGTTTVSHKLTLSGALSASHGMLMDGAASFSKTVSVSGNISGTAAIQGHSLAIQNGATITGSSINHGSLTLQGTLSSSGGATFLGNIIAHTGSFSGSIGIGTPSPGSPLTLANANVSTGITNVAVTEAYATLGPIHATRGGLMINGLSDQDSADARTLALRGISNDTHTDTVPLVEIIGAKRSGTSVQALADAETVVQVANHTTTLMTVLGSGKVGIGDTTPSHLLTIAGAVSGSGAAIIGGTATFTKATSIVASGSISGAAAIQGHSLAIQNGITVTGSSINHGSLTLQGTLSSSAAAVIGGTATFTKAASIVASGSISGAAAIQGHSLAIQNGITVTGSSINHGSLTLQNGTLSSSTGANFLGTVIANTIEASSSIMSAGKLTITGSISGAAGLSAHSLSIQAGATITGSSTHHGALTLENGTLSSSGGATFLGSIFAEDVNISGTLSTAGAFSPSKISASAGVSAHGGFITDSTLEVSGTTFLAGVVNISGNVQLGNAASDVVTSTAQITASEGLKLGNALFANSQNIYNVGTITASIGSFDELQVNTLKSTTTTAHNVDMSGSLIIASGAADSADADGFGLIISGANAHLTWDHGNTRMDLSKPLAITGIVSSSATIQGHALSIQSGMTVTGSSINHGSLTLQNGTLSSSGGATFLGSIFAEDVNVSGTLTAATFAPSAMSGNVAINVNNPIFANGLNVSGTSVYAANISSSGEAVFGGEVIMTNTLLMSGNISSSAKGAVFGGGTTISNTLNVSGTTTLAGNLSSSGEVIFGGEAIFSNAVLASSSLTIVGDISSSAGNLIIGGGTTISNTLNVTGAITTAGNVTSSAAIQGHSLAIQAGATITGSSINHGSLTLQGTLSSSGGATFLGSIFAEDVNISGATTAAGNVLPVADNTHDLGSESKRWANVYTGDLHLRNERGDWTILEEEDYLCVVNNRTGKKYKMMLQELED